MWEFCEFCEHNGVLCDMCDEGDQFEESDCEVVDDEAIDSIVRRVIPIRMIA
jgi:hypothetical protein